MAPAVSPCTCYFQYQATFWISSILRESVGHQVQLGTPQKTSRNEQAASEEKCQPTKPMQTKHATQTKAKQTNLTIVNHGKRNQPTNQPNLTNVINQTTQKKKKKKKTQRARAHMYVVYVRRSAVALSTYAMCTLACKCVACFKVQYSCKRHVLSPTASQVRASAT